MTPVVLGGVMVGPGYPAFVICELGISHNGDTVTAEKMIDAAAYAKCQAVKVQARNIDTFYTAEEMARPLESPWGTTRGDYIRKRELSEQQLKDLNAYAKAKGLQFTSSCWDLPSLELVERVVDPPWIKIASASITDRDLVYAHAELGKPLVMSTGMSTVREIDRAVGWIADAQGARPRDVQDLILLACTSTYPCDPEDVNLKTIETLSARYGVPVGFSHHDRSIALSVAAVALGACAVERHITLDRASFGSDQASSIEPGGFARMVRDIRVTEAAMGSGEKRLLPSEEPVRARLRRVGK